MYLYGANIFLREYRSDDLPAIRAWVNDPETVKYLSTRYWTAQSVSNTAEFLDQATRSLGGNAAYFVIADNADERYVGQIDLISINWKLRSAELAMVIGAEALRGKGIGQQAIALMLAFAFDTMGLERVELEVHADNRRAVRCYEKAGFVHEGVKRHAYYSEGRFCDVAIMSVLADEWRTRRAQAE